MERSDSKEPGAEKAAGASTATTNTRPTAIERQIAAATSQPKINSHTNPTKSRYLTSGNLLVLLLLVTTGLVFVFSNSGRPLRETVSSVWKKTAQTAHTPDVSLNTTVPTAVPKKAAKTSTPSALSIPIAEVTLRDRPELLEQLVQVYRAQIAENPNDPTALAALYRLREQSLSELEMIVAAGNDPVAARSLEVASKLFPELVDNPRYKSLSARMGQIHREAEIASTTEPAPVPAHEITRATNLATMHTPSTTAVASTKVVSLPVEPSAAVTLKPAQHVPPPKPEVHVISITPGSMVEQHFVASADGNLLMVEISYRNFENRSEDQSEVTLTTRLGFAEDTEVLAEVPVVIDGDRGTKDFVMEPLIHGDIDEKYKLNFILNNEPLTSRTAHASMPKP